MRTLSAKEIGYGKTTLLKAWQKIDVTFDSDQFPSYPPSGEYCQVFKSVVEVVYLLKIDANSLRDGSQDFYKDKESNLGPFASF